MGLSVAAHATSATSWRTDPDLPEGCLLTWANGKVCTYPKGCLRLPFIGVYVSAERRESAEAGYRVQIYPEVSGVTPAKS